MSEFTVEDYTVSVSANSNNRSDALIKLTSPDLTHGIRNSANLIFGSPFPNLDSLNAIGYVFNVGGLNYNGIHLWAFYNHRVFDDIYKIIQTEKPVNVIFNFRDIPDNTSSSTKLLTYIKVGTESEQLGEGPFDADAIQAQVTEALQATI